MSEQKLKFEKGKVYLTRGGRLARWMGHMSPERDDCQRERDDFFVLFDLLGNPLSQMVTLPDGRVDSLDETQYDIVSEMKKDIYDKTVLREAEHLMTGDRHEDYGPAPVEFERVAKLWSVVLGCAVTPRMAALCMVQLKLAREVHRHKRDNVVDAAAYLQIAADCERVAREREEGAS